jgi:thiosulfate reductase cytochrome b subunit
MAKSQSPSGSDNRHSLWVRITHWVGAVAFLLLVFTGFEILMVHPRLYWGEVGNDLTPAFLELPISRNYKHDGWEKKTAFFTDKNSPVSAVRTYDIFNQNGWGRSLHFLSAWILVVTGLCYLIAAILSGHLYRQLLPKKISSKLFFQDIKDHLVKRIPQRMTGVKYGVLQKTTYSVVLLFLFPVITLTGLTMSPAITAACPFLLKIFFGLQSARTIHFFAAFLLVLFLLIHIVMVMRTGFKKNMLAITIGNKNPDDEKQ